MNFRIHRVAADSGGDRPTPRGRSVIATRFFRKVIISFVFLLQKSPIKIKIILEK